MYNLQELYPNAIIYKVMPKSFDLSTHSTDQLQGLELGILAGLSEARRFHVQENEVILKDYLVLVKAAIAVARNRESEQWADQSIEEIKQALK